MFLTQLHFSQAYLTTFEFMHLSNKNMISLVVLLQLSMLWMCDNNYIIIIIIISVHVCELD